MTLRWTTLTLLAVIAGTAGGQDAPPAADFLAFLGGLEADEDWAVFFASVPEEMIDGQATLADMEPADAEEDNELD